MLSPVPDITGAPAWQKMGTERRRELTINLLGVMLLLGQRTGTSEMGRAAWPGQLTVLPSAIDLALEI